MLRSYRHDKSSQSPIAKKCLRIDRFVQLEGNL